MSPNILSKSSLANLKCKEIFFALLHDSKESDTYCFNKCFSGGSFPNQKLETPEQQNWNSKDTVTKCQLKAPQCFTSQILAPHLETIFHKSVSCIGFSSSLNNQCKTFTECQKIQHALPKILSSNLSPKQTQMYSDSKREILIKIS